MYIFITLLGTVYIIKPRIFILLEHLNCMIITKNELNSCLKYEKNIYSEYMFSTKWRFFISKLKREPVRVIYSYLVLSRKSDFYYYKIKNNNKSIFNKLLYLLFITKKNRLGEKLGLEITSIDIKPGLLIYHYNNVLNGNSIIGKNCHLHGNNSIGNDGKT